MVDYSKLAGLTDEQWSLVFKIAHSTHGLGHWRDALSVWAQHRRDARAGPSSDTAPPDLAHEAALDREVVEREQERQAVGKRLDAMEKAVAAIQPATLVRSDELAEALRVGLDGKHVDRRLTQIEERQARRDDRASALTLDVITLEGKVAALEAAQANPSTKMIEPQADPATVAAWKAEIGRKTAPMMRASGWYLAWVDIGEAPEVMRFVDGRWRGFNAVGGLRHIEGLVHVESPLIEAPGGPLDKAAGIA